MTTHSPRLGTKTKSLVWKGAFFFSAFIFCAAANAAEAVDYRAQMRGFVREISEYAKSRREGFAVIPQNGLELALSADGKAETDYLTSIDGAGQEDVLFGYAGDYARTPEDITAYFRRLCGVFQANGKRILAIDYCRGKEAADFSYSENEKSGFLSFAADDRLLRTIPPHPQTPYHSNSGDVRTLHDAKNFLYLINSSQFASKRDFIDALKATDYDLVIVDLFHNGEQLTHEDITELRTKKNGGAQLTVCYMSIGEAEDYRYYWRREWKRRRPAWLTKENPEWRGNYKVRYWHPDWKNLIMGNPDSYLDKILSAGFDGVYLDIIDAFEYFESQRTER
ncbi:MAG: endo alpha-1,4 polygalactosaminidase [Treponema sp.]